MDLSTINLIAIGAFAVGTLAKLLVPWLIKRYRNPDAPDSAWNWRYFWPQLVGFVVVLLVAPVLNPDISKVNMLPPFAAYLAGWGTADMAKTLVLDTGVVNK